MQADPGVGINIWVPYCGAAPFPSDLLWRWNLDPALLLAFTLVPFLCRSLWRESGPRRLGLAAAWLIGLVLFVSPFCAATSALFSVRVVHHVVLTTVLAPLIVLALPRLSRPWLSLSVWTVVHALIFWAWHAPGIYAWALSSDLAYWLMQASLLGSAIGLWLAVRRAEALASVTALLATMVQMGLLGALLTFSGTANYAPHFATTFAWGLTPLEDQQLGGLLMWVPGAGLYLAAAAIILARWLHRAQHSATA